MRKSVLMVLLILGLFLQSGQAIATQLNTKDVEIGIMRYTAFKTITPTLTISGTTATYALNVTCSTDVTSISAILQIQKLNASGAYDNYGSSWTASSSRYTLSTSGTKTVDSGGTYRLKATVTAYYPGGSSTETVYS